MSNTVIKVDNLSKRYIIGHQSQDRYQTLRDQIAIGAKRFGKRLLHPLKASSGQPLLGVDESEEFWALKDVSFEVKQGDRIGIIGRNGAGKSTLLKILSRITEPTSGQAKIKGRVSSLLEVGTGFHPELTGRENIFLNGAVLGMSRQDIKKRFDEIVAFAEVEKFLDTPVKRYSSGMYVRLAFAVAAHLEPEILIIDEVLAVGDAQFQKKCLGKMQEVGEEGRTVLFVSHNMSAVNQLCNSALYLYNGRISGLGTCSKIINMYYESSNENSSLITSEVVYNPPKDLPFFLVAVRVLDEKGTILKINRPHVGGMQIQIDYRVIQPHETAYVVCNIVESTTGVVWWQYDGDTSIYGKRKTGDFRAILEIPQSFFREGLYILKPAIVDPYTSPLDNPSQGCPFNIGEKNSLLSARGVRWPSSIKFLSKEWKTIGIK